MIGCVEIERGAGAGSSNADEILQHVAVVIAPRGDAVNDAVAHIIVRLIQGNRKRRHRFCQISSHQRPALPRR